MRAKSGFTLVEILIVVVILGILAAIVIPQFTGASTEAKESSLVSNLQSIRSQVELFKIQHNDILPGEILSETLGTTTACPDGASFVNAMCKKTNQYGVLDTSSGADSTFRFGPYMRRLPVNPFSAVPDTTITVEDLSEAGSSVAVGAAKTTGGSTSGWFFVISGTDYGLFQAADPLLNPVDDTPHVDY